mmetsp:Transcript_4803/g.7097  ORF Transcript_4803/g.7097 Transcript_4803/m.7097 type:complete len:235 (+) Transcript_4803:899-1603(+)
MESESPFLIDYFKSLVTITGNLSLTSLQNIFTISGVLIDMLKSPASYNFQDAILVLFVTLRTYIGLKSFFFLCYVRFLRILNPSKKENKDDDEYQCPICKVKLTIISCKRLSTSAHICTTCYKTNKLIIFVSMTITAIIYNSFYSVRTFLNIRSIDSQRVPIDINLFYSVLALQNIFAVLFIFFIFFGIFYSSIVLLFPFYLYLLSKIVQYIRKKKQKKDTQQEDLKETLLNEI